MNDQPKNIIFTIDAIRVIMDPINWNNSDHKYTYDVEKVLNRHKYIHVFFYEKRDSWFYNIKFKKSFIESVKNWLRKYYHNKVHK